MSLSPEESKLHEAYEALPDEPKSIIDNAFSAFIRELTDANYVIHNDDRAEVLIARMTEYFLNANPSFRKTIKKVSIFDKHSLKSNSKYSIKIMERDRWSGPELQGTCYFPDKNTASQFMNEYNSTLEPRGPGGQAPDYYVQAEGPYAI